MQILADLFGYTILSKEVERGNYDMNNLQYILSKNQKWSPRHIDPDVLWDSLYNLGAINYTTDYNMWLESLGMTLGQALIFGTDSLPHMEITIKNNTGPRVWAENIGDSVHLSSQDPIQTAINNQDPFYDTDSGF